MTLRLLPTLSYDIRSPTEWRSRTRTEALKPIPTPHTTTVISAKEGVAKSIKALNHRGTKATKEKLFFVLFVPFVVPFFSGPFATTSFAGMTAVWASALGGSRALTVKQKKDKQTIKKLERELKRKDKACGHHDNLTEPSLYTCPA